MERSGEGKRPARESTGTSRDVFATTPRFGDHPAFFPLTPCFSNHSVILTKVRTQGNERCLVWLLVLTFVRMMDGVGRRANLHARQWYFYRINPAARRAFSIVA